MKLPKIYEAEIHLDEPFKCKTVSRAQVKLHGDIFLADSDVFLLLAQFIPGRSASLNH